MPEKHLWGGDVDDRDSEVDLPIYGVATRGYGRDSRANGILGEIPS